MKPEIYISYSLDRVKKDLKITDRVKKDLKITDQVKKDLKITDQVKKITENNRSDQKRT